MIEGRGRESYSKGIEMISSQTMIPVGDARLATGVGARETRSMLAFSTMAMKGVEENGALDSYHREDTSICGVARCLFFRFEDGGCGDLYVCILLFDVCMYSLFFFFLSTACEGIRGI
jgi:hypothetical protein